jgi:DNA invertase Pin-like site-specific DNA recombinase
MAQEDSASSSQWEGNMAAKRVALYARVSTDGQSVENQLRELETVAVKEGWEIVERFVDKGISGAKGREGRPAFDKLCKGMVRREFEIVAVWSVDRLGCSLQDLVAFLNELHSKHTRYGMRAGQPNPRFLGAKLFQ